MTPVRSFVGYSSLRTICLWSRCAPRSTALPPTRPSLFIRRYDSAEPEDGHGLNSILLFQWFLDRPGDDLTVLKHQVDWLFYKERYEEACQRARRALALLWAGATGTRRELFEAILECALKANDHELAQQMYIHLASIRVEDSSLEHVLAKAAAQLRQLNANHDNGDSKR